VLMGGSRRSAPAVGTFGRWARRLRGLDSRLQPSEVFSWARPKGKGDSLDGPRDLQAADPRRE